MNDNTKDPRENWPKLLVASVACLFLCFTDLDWFSLSGLNATFGQVVLLAAIACLLLYCGRHIGTIIAFDKSQLEAEL